MKHANWQIPRPGLGNPHFEDASGNVHTATYYGAMLAVLVDIREELAALRELLRAAPLPPEIKNYERRTKR